MKDQYNNFVVTSLFSPLSISATQYAVEVDLKDFNSATFAWVCGIEGGTLSGSLGWTLTITHADETSAGVAGSYSNVDETDILGATPSSGIVKTLSDPAHDDQTYTFGYVGGKRFVKLLISEVGTTTGMPQALLVIKGNSRIKPYVA